jgi:hypothetical protein
MLHLLSLYVGAMLTDDIKSFLWSAFNALCLRKVLVVVRSKAWVWSCSIAGIACSNPAECWCVIVVCPVGSELIARSEECVCVSNCVWYRNSFSQSRRFESYTKLMLVHAQFFPPYHRLSSPMNQQPASKVVTTILWIVSSKVKEIF